MTINVMPSAMQRFAGNVRISAPKDRSPEAMDRRAAAIRDTLDAARGMFPTVRITTSPQLPAAGDKQGKMSLNPALYGNILVKVSNVTANAKVRNKARFAERFIASSLTQEGVLSRRSTKSRQLALA
jgi:hypothetical protein